MLAEKIKSKCSKAFQNKWLVSFIVLAVISAVVLLFAISNLHGRIKTEAQILAPKAETASAPISSGVTYEQSFASRGTFNRIQLFFAPSGSPNTGATTVELYTASGNSITRWEIENSTITEGPVLLELDGGAQEKGDYRLTVSSDSPDPGASAGIFLQKGSIYEGELRIDGEVQESDISIGLYQQTNLGYFLLIGILLFSLICLWVSFILLFIYKTALWKTAIVLLMGFGMAYLFIFPSGTVNDTWRHYITVYDYSNDLLGIPKDDSGTVMMRKSDLDTYVRYRAIPNLNPCIDQYFEEFDEFSWRCADKTLVASGEKSLVTRGNNASSMVAYFPQIVGLTVGRLLSLGAIPCIFLARFIQLVCVALMIGFAVKLIPVGKEMLLLLSLVPIFMQQITALSYDGVAFGFAFLLIALCVKFRFEKTAVSTEAYIALLLSAMGLAACRGGMYIVLLALLLIIPNTVLSSWKKLFAGLAGIFTTLAFYGNVYFNVSSSAGGGSETALSLGSPFEHPIQIGMAMVSSLIENVDIYVGGMFGQRMGWHNPMMPFTLAFTFLLLVLIVNLSVDIPSPSLTEDFSVKDKAVLFLPILFTVGISFFMMYVGENHRATAWNIWGVQGRYFIPVLPLAFLMLRNRFIVLKKDIRKIVIYLFCNLEVLAFFSLLRVYLIR